MLGRNVRGRDGAARDFRPGLQASTRAGAGGRQPNLIVNKYILAVFKDGIIHLRPLGSVGSHSLAPPNRAQWQAICSVRVGAGEQQEVTSVASPTSTFLLTQVTFFFLFLTFGDVWRR